MLPAYVPWITEMIELDSGLDEPDVLFVMPLAALSPQSVVDHAFVRALFRWKVKDECRAWRLWAAGPQATMEIDRYYSGDQSEDPDTTRRIVDALQTPERTVVWVTIGCERRGRVQVGGDTLQLVEGYRWFERFADEVGRHGFGVDLEEDPRSRVLGYTPERGDLIGWEDAIGPDWERLMDHWRVGVHVDADLDNWHESAVDSLVRALIRAAIHVTG